MSAIVDVIIAFASGGLISTLINVFLSRRSRRAEGIKSYQDTIDMLMQSNSELIEDRTKLMQEISDLRAQLTQRHD